MLLLNLCRKYAYKFNKLFPLCESNNIKNQNLFELKNTIIQYNNMIFNKNITKIFELNENNNNDFLNNILNDNDEILILNKKIKELSEQIEIFKKNEIIYNENINNLNKKIEILNNELINKENIIQDLKNKKNIKSSSKIKEFHGLVESHEDININKLNEKNSNKKSDKNEMSNKIKNSYSKTNNNNLRFKVDDIINNINNKLNFDIDEDKPSNTEIEKLDQEIFNLKSKLKNIIKK